MTHGKYITNASFNGISVSNADKKLTEEWEKSNISYPRTDGINHKEIIILNEKKINPEVKNMLEFNIERIKKTYNKVNEHTIYFIAEKLNLSTPSALIEDVKKAINYTKKILNIEDIKRNLKKFKINKINDMYIDIKDAKLRDIINNKNKKLQKDKFNKELDKIR